MTSNATAQLPVSDSDTLTDRAGQRVPLRLSIRHFLVRYLLDGAQYQRRTSVKRMAECCLQRDAYGAGVDIQVSGPARWLISGEHGQGVQQCPPGKQRMQRLAPAVKRGEHPAIVVSAIRLGDLLDEALGKPHPRVAQVRWMRAASESANIELALSAPGFMALRSVG